VQLSARNGIRARGKAVIGQYQSSDGLRLAYRDIGNGVPVLCLPGLTRSMADFQDMAARLDLERVRLIMPDYRGRGASDHDPNPMNYAVPVEAGDILALLDHLGLPRAGVIGSSRGGMIGMVLAATAPGRIAGVLLNDIGPKIARPGLERIAQYVGRNPPHATLAAGAAALARSPGFVGVSPERWRIEAERLWRETPGGLVNRYDNALRIGFDAAMQGPEADLWPLFDAMAAIPVGLIRGANSDLITPQTVAAMRERRPDMLFVDVPGRAHIPFLDEDESLAVITAFLDML